MLNCTARIICMRKECPKTGLVDFRILTPGQPSLRSVRESTRSSIGALTPWMQRRSERMVVVSSLGKSSCGEAENAERGLENAQPDVGFGTLENYLFFFK